MDDTKCCDPCPDDQCPEDPCPVVTDNVTIIGDGTNENPLKTVAGATPVVADQVTITGLGTPGSPLSTVPGGTAVVHDDTLLGDGTVLSPLSALPVKFAPARTLFVAQSWPTGHDPTIYFTTISAALVQAATMNPLSANQVLIQIYSGTYTENLTLVSNVALAAATPGASFVQLNGNVTWLPGVGVNAPQAALAERATFNGITIGTAFTTTVDTTGKTAGAAVFSSQQAVFGPASFTGRGLTLDTAFFFLANFNDLVTWTNMRGGAGGNVGVEIVGSRLRAMTHFRTSIAFRAKIARIE